MIDRIANEVAIQCMDCGIITDIRQFKDILVMALNNYTVSPKEKAIAVYDDLSKGPNVLCHEESKRLIRQEPKIL